MHIAGLFKFSCTKLHLVAPFSSNAGECSNFADDFDFACMAVLSRLQHPQETLAQQFQAVALFGMEYIDQMFKFGFDDMNCGAGRSVRSFVAAALAQAVACAVEPSCLRCRRPRCAIARQERRLKRPGTYRDEDCTGTREVQSCITKFMYVRCVARRFARSTVKIILLFGGEHVFQHDAAVRRGPGQYKLHKPWHHACVTTHQRCAQDLGQIDCISERKDPLNCVVSDR